MNAALQAKLKSLTANQKKLSALLLLVAVGLLLWGRLLWTQQVPRVVMAHPEEASGLAPGSEGSAPANAPAPRATVYVDLPTDLARDLFAAAEAPAPLTPEPDKSGPQVADDNQQTTPTAKGLVLQTTILGTPPRALINGRLLVPGDRINGFTLRRILRREVVLEMNGIEVRLGM
jgi:hypothetical protein